MAAQKILTILRHAKALTGTASQPDRDRALAERGISEAAAMGKYLAEHEIVPDRILCSIAVRTRQTFAHLQEAYGEKLPVEYSEKLYNASAGEIANLVAGVSEKTHHLMLIGHNPGVHELAIKLAKAGEDRLITRVTVEFPPCALATIAFDGAWANIRFARGTLVDFVTPNNLK